MRVGNVEFAGTAASAVPGHDPMGKFIEIAPRLLARRTKTAA
jgi:hypothetical protein